MKVAFVLPARAGGGGVHSVVQEAAEMHRMGVQVRLLVNEKNLASFLSSYPADLRVREFIDFFSDTDTLSAQLRPTDIVVGTIYTSMALIRDALVLWEEEAQRPIIAYYIQDYEPLFARHKTAEWERAVASYKLFPDTLCFAKTRWLCDIVFANHGITVAKVDPSLDHSVYFPSFERARAGLSFCAMLRPSTPRRAPQRTTRILNWLAERLGDGVTVSCFGCSAEELPIKGLHLHPNVRCLGPLRREQVAETLRQTDFFLDLSDYQAFGRTGLEAMACGCIPLLPDKGGPAEFVTEGVNGFLMNTADDQDVLAALDAAIRLQPRELQAMRLAGIITASKLSPVRAAASELALFASALQ